MCTDTFRRLPEEKRNRFLEAAWEEFTTVSFAEASINQIVRRAGVPRGSFYQYFADKENLFSYLMEQVRAHLTSEYQHMVVQGGGDIFQTQLLCYDRFARQGLAVDILFGRCIQILRLNSGLHLQMMLVDQPECGMLSAIWDQLDLTAFACRDRAFVQQVFLLSLLALAGAVMDTLKAPEEAAQHREALLTRLEIIKHGSLSPEPTRGQSAKEVSYA